MKTRVSKYNPLKNLISPFTKITSFYYIVQIGPLFYPLDKKHHHYLFFGYYPMYKIVISHVRGQVKYLVTSHVTSCHMSCHITCVVTSDVDGILSLTGLDPFFEINSTSFLVINRLCYVIKNIYLIENSCIYLKISMTTITM